MSNKDFLNRLKEKERTQRMLVEAIDDLGAEKKRIRNLILRFTVAAAIFCAAIFLFFDSFIPSLGPLWAEVKNTVSSWGELKKTPKKEVEQVAVTPAQAQPKAAAPAAAASVTGAPVVTGATTATAVTSAATSPAATPASATATIGATTAPIATTDPNGPSLPVVAMKPKSKVVDSNEDPDAYGGNPNAMKSPSAPAPVALEQLPALSATKAGVVAAQAQKSPHPASTPSAESLDSARAEPAHPQNLPALPVLPTLPTLPTVQHAPVAFAPPAAAQEKLAVELSNAIKPDAVAGYIPRSSFVEASPAEVAKLPIPALPVQSRAPASTDYQNSAQPPPALLGFKNAGKIK